MGLQVQNAGGIRYFGLSATGLVVKVQISKAGGSLVDPAAGFTTLSELGGGLYFFTMQPADTDTLGALGFALTDNGSGAPLTTADAWDLVCLQPPGGDVINVRGDIEGNLVGNVAGNVNGKVLGFGAGVFHAPGVLANLADGSITDTTITGPAPAAGPASTPLTMLQQLWRRFFKRVVKDDTAKTIKTYANNGTTVYTTQNYTASGGSEDVGAAS